MTQLDDPPHKYRQYFRGVPIRTPLGRAPVRWPVELGEDLAQHIERTGFIHVDELAALADADGRISIVDLPQPTRLAKPPKDGPDTWHNPLRWEDIDDSEVEP